MYPFTYKEHLEHKKANNLPIKEDDFVDCLKNGGRPQRYAEIDKSGIKECLRSLCHFIIEKDVFEFHLRINHSEFENVSKYIISTTGKPFSALSIAKYLKNDKDKDEQKHFHRQSATTRNT